MEEDARYQPQLRSTKFSVGDRVRVKQPPKSPLPAYVIGKIGEIVGVYPGLDSRAQFIRQGEKMDWEPRFPCNLIHTIAAG